MDIMDQAIGGVSILAEDLRQGSQVLGEIFLGEQHPVEIRVERGE